MYTSVYATLCVLKKQAKRLRYVFVNFVHFCGGKSVRYVVVENILRV